MPVRMCVCFYTNLKWPYETVMARKKSPPDKAKHRLNKKYLLYTGGIYLCFYHHSYIIDKTFFKLQ